MTAFLVEIVDKDAYVNELEQEVERLDRENRMLARRLAELDADSQRMAADLARGPGE